MTPGFLVLVGVFGLMVGSFLNVCISRIPAGSRDLRRTWQYAQSDGGFNASSRRGSGSGA